MHKYIKLIAILFFGYFQTAVSQEKNKDSIGTETVTVVKAYKPTISDAFKIKSSPVINDSIVLKKKNISYNIFSVPVASTFTPEKGQASKVEKTPPPVLFNSYASLGFGTYDNALAEFYTSRSINRDERLDIGLMHHSARGDVDRVALNNAFYDTKLTGAYSKRDRDMDWGANVELQHQLYNWYGLPIGIYTDEQIADIDAKQNYFNAEVSGHLSIDDGYFERGEVLIRRFWDATNSAENRAMLKGAAEIPIGDENIAIKTKLDYLGGDFKNADVKNIDNSPAINYGFFQIGIGPSIEILRDDLTLNLGVNLVYGMDIENSDSNFYIYPDITASYRLVDDTVIAYGGIQGELIQNSFHDFVEENSFVSPTLTIQPTDQKYNAYAGIKGQLLPNLSYNVKASYKTENRKPLFKWNPLNEFRDDEKGYYYRNSFEVFYDDLKTIGIFGELNFNIKKEFTLGVNGEAFSYTTETDDPAWNLPKLKGSLFADYHFLDNWFLGATLFYVGERTDLATDAVQNVQPSEFPSEIITLNSYFDANAQLGYKFNTQLSAFVKANNIVGNSYQRWANYPVQGFQVLLGATYKFDF
ncbi:TonB-dependent receptor [Cellulophaga sp. HaHaR_3_176]|uniref:TonB-dependent receptor n=1 Tax=Cellulophaga sp. HaHaR_3_176 TaxID=1942464 RepID=UPI001C1F2BD8|nr:TonB-dependent receptor [Cellulophaga sp. HaHaR_3_176]QWX82886.1 TonB-dependent receptor [Cellulophaga sp. HaHaR_3_176]